MHCAYVQVFFDPVRLTALVSWEPLLDPEFNRAPPTPATQAAEAQSTWTVDSAESPIPITYTAACLLWIKRTRLNREQNGSGR
jgi:hypothetical protein